MIFSLSHRTFPLNGTLMFTKLIMHLGLNSFLHHFLSEVDCRFYTLKIYIFNILLTQNNPLSLKSRLTNIFLQLFFATAANHDRARATVFFSNAFFHRWPPKNSVLQNAIRQDEANLTEYNGIQKSWSYILNFKLLKGQQELTF